MFTHFIYIVEDPVDRLMLFDPLRDLLVAQSSYLTWRRVDQNTPSGRCKIYGAVYKTHEEEGYISWNLVHFDTRRAFAGIERWLQRESSRFPKNHLGKYENTRCRGLLTSIIHPTPQARRADYHEKIELLQYMIEELKPRLFHHYDPEPVNPVSEWGEIRDNTIEQLLELTTT